MLFTLLVVVPSVRDVSVCLALLELPVKTTRSPLRKAFVDVPAVVDLCTFFDAINFSYSVPGAATLPRALLVDFLAPPNPRLTFWIEVTENKIVFCV